MSQFHTYKTPIPDDAKQVAYFSAHDRGRAPRIVDVERRTKTTVKVVGLEQLFRKDDGYAKGDVYAGGRARIEPVTPEHLDWIKATELHAELQVANARLQQVVNALTAPNKFSRKSAEVRANIDAVYNAIRALGVDVVIEKELP